MSETTDLVFYDGDCGLCHRSVRVLAQSDADGSRFRFAPIGGSAFQERVRSDTAAAVPDSVLVLTPSGDLLARSSAVVRCGRRLGGMRALLAHALWLVPKPVRDIGYRMIAAARRRYFARPHAACPVVAPELRSRFLD